GPLDLGTARATARRAMRRAGLFATGDVGTVLRFTALELGEDDAILGESGGLERFCTARPEAAEIVRLASGLEYAGARWQNASPRSGRPV
ncbi:MAG: hypothetical protein HOV80_29195, partial [Polyangiaceae bacterium]|nr:hypothetical protein [Polyangiaceae bacterium]